MDNHDFWKEVERRRNLVFCICFAYVPASWITLELKRAGLPEEPVEISRDLLFLLLGIALHIRATRLECPQCGKEKCLQHAFFFMRDAVCRHCGMAYRDKSTPPASFKPSTGVS